MEVPGIYWYTAPESGVHTASQRCTVYTGEYVLVYTPYLLTRFRVSCMVW